MLKKKDKQEANVVLHMSHDDVLSQFVMFKKYAEQCKDPDDLLPCFMWFMNFLGLMGFEEQTQDLRYNTVMMNVGMAFISKLQELKLFDGDKLQSMVDEAFDNVGFNFGMMKEQD